jgi:hypothetical protein
VLGRDALRVRGKVGLFYFGFSFDAADGELWVDPATSLPIQQTFENPRTHTLASKTVFSWLPRTAATAGETTLSVPTGYKHTTSTGLPHIFGD